MAAYSSLVGLAVGGKYEVRRVLGAGGMGVVCEAIHTDLGKKVALKLIDKSMKESELIVARFRREARALGQIESEHIVEVFDVGADSRVGLYMVMEHLAGEDLQTRLERDKKLDVKTAVMIAHQIARGLAKAHAAGVVHRDLKPANVFLTKRDNGQMLVKLLDFGVSKLLADEKGARITGSGAPIGTPLYMSPEQAEGKDDTDGRADVWSLGALLYESLAGTPPFADRGSYHGTIVGILTSRPKLLFDAAPWVPEPLAKVVDAMLVHDRDARIKDAETVTARLLDAYPAVLPDGTGRHTAIIMSQGAGSVDTTGDTEFFTSSSMPAGFRQSRPSGSPSSQPADSGRVSGPPESSEAKRTAAATPIEVPPAPTTGSTVKLPPSQKRGTDASRTDPLPAPWASASSSAGGVSMPETPAVMEPLPMSVVPDTMRDDQLALRAERRRNLMLGGIGVAIVLVAVLGYLAGRRANNVVPPPPVSATTGTGSAAAPPPSPSASAAATATASSAKEIPSVPASALPPAGSASARGLPKRRILAPAKGDGPPPETPNPNAPDEKPPENPYPR